MAGVRFPELQSRPIEFLDFTSLTLDEFQQLVPPFEAAFQARMAPCSSGWEAADGSPVYRVPKLPPADTGRSALVYPGLPENVCPPGRAGTRVRDGPEQSQSMDSHPLASPAGRTPCPR